MVELNIDGKIDKSIGYVDQRQQSLSQSRNYAMSASLRYLRGKTFDWITSFGEGTWKDFHPLTNFFQKSGNQFIRRSRFVSRSNLNWMIQAVATWQLKNSGGLKFGAGNSPIAKRAAKIESGYKTIVNPKMRALFGSTRNQVRSSPMLGKNFFPLRKSTTKISAVPRPVISPVYARYGGKVGPVFEKAIIESLEV